MLSKETKEKNRIRNKELYHINPAYRKRQKKNANQRNRAIAILINKHKKDYLKILEGIKQDDQ